jgi:predicted Holliday junction resolvase-like endonuclease
MEDTAAFVQKLLDYGGLGIAVVLLILVVRHLYRDVKSARDQLMEQAKGHKDELKELNSGHKNELLAMEQRYSTKTERMREQYHEMTTEVAQLALQLEKRWGKDT